MSCDNDGTRTAQSREQDDNISIHAMEDQEFVPYGRDELQADEQCCWENAEKVQFHAWLNVSNSTCVERGRD